MIDTGHEGVTLTDTGHEGVTLTDTGHEGISGHEGFTLTDTGHEPQAFAVIAATAINIDTNKVFINSN